MSISGSDPDEIHEQHDATGEAGSVDVGLPEGERKRSVWPTFTTGGGGFTFEDLIGGWLAAGLLAGSSPLGVTIGVPASIRFQSGSDGWRLDDFLVTSGGDEARRWTASAKSYNMLTGGRLPDEFVQQAWSDLLRDDHREGLDHVGLVCGQAAQGNWASLEKLITYSAADPAGMLARVHVEGAFNETDRTLWNSAQCPADVIAAHGLQEPPTPAALLRAMLPLRLDFFAPTSQAMVEALGWCRDALIAEQADRGQDLMRALLTLVAGFRPKGGVLDWPMLVLRLGHEFAFRLRPDVAPEWQILTSHTTAAMEGVRDTLGQDIKLPRLEALTELQAATANRPSTVLFGPSGCGKTALAKRWLQSHDGQTLWLTATDLEDGLTGLSTTLRLRRGVIEVLSLAPGRVWIVIDGLDRAYTLEPFRATAGICRRAADSDGQITIVITSQQAELPRVSEQLATANAPALGRLVLTNFDAEDLQVVLAASPRLAQVVIGGQLVGVFRRPKLLDLLVRAAEAGDQLQSVTDEAAVARLWWQRFVAVAPNAAARETFLIRLAETQADHLMVATAVGDLEVADVGPVDQLKADGVLSDDPDHFAFGHDLFADWTLLRRLRALAGTGTAAVLAGKASLPSWHRAIRLFALEQLAEQGLQVWDQTRAELDQQDQRLVADLFLDAPLFADAPLGLLEQLWPVLSDRDSGLLRRLLRRFLHVATVPDPRGRVLFSDSPELETEWSARARLPVWPLWGPMLAFLDQHRDEAIDLARGEAVAITDLWLRHSSPGWPDRDRAARIAMTAGVWLRDALAGGAIVDDELERAIWRCVLAAGAVDLEAVRDLLIPLLDPDTAANGEDAVAVSGRELRAIDELRTAVLDGDGLITIVWSDPAAAAELALLASVDIRTENHFSIQDNRLQITDEPRWLAPLPERGPFLALLREAPDDGVGLVLALVEHATERWLATENIEEGTGTPGWFSIAIDDDEIQLIGDARVMHWFRGAPQVPTVLASALMALEQYLYEQLDVNTDIAPILKRLTASRSVAAWGLLTEVAKYRPALLHGPLVAIVSSAGLILSDKLYASQDHSYLLIAAVGERALGERVKRWNLMPHRKNKIVDLVIRDVFMQVALVDELAAARERWTAPNDGRWRHLIAQMDPTNLRTAQQEDGSILIEYVPPEELEGEVAESRRDIADSQFWWHLPYQLREWIDEAHPQDDATLEEFWERFQQRLSQPATASMFEDGLRSLDDLRCGVAALYVTCARDWLAGYPEREQWCRDALLAPFQSPPPTHTFDFYGDSSTERWDVFCADAIPILWAENPADLELRSAVVRLAVNAHYETVARTFRNVSRHPVLADDLLALEHASLYWARYVAWTHQQKRIAESAAFGFREREEPEEPVFDLAAPTREALDAFTVGELSADVPRLGDWVAGTPEGMLGLRTRDHMRILLCLSFGYLVRARVHLVSQLTTAVPGSRERIFTFAGDLATLIVTGLTTQDHQLFDDERDVLRLLAAFTLNGTRQEAHTVWEPILAAGGAAGNWVEAYLNALWSQALAAVPRPPAFATVVSDMLVYATQAQSWQTRGSGDLQVAVIGLNRWGSSVADVDAELIEALQPHWAEWVRPRMRGSWFARSIVRFLQSPAAGPVLGDALGWLADRERSDAQPDTDLDSEIMDLLVKLHSRDPEFLRGSDGPATDARFLLERAAGRGVALALELIGRIG
jgi:hypothetical protein